jgi:hypothetical protein
MIEICERNRAKVKDQRYLNTLVAELDMRCLEIEAAMFESELDEIQITTLQDVIHDTAIDQAYLDHLVIDAEENKAA